MKYQVVQTEDLEKLIEEVNALLRDGWIVAGGITIGVYHFHDRDNNLDSNVLYLQALTKVTA